MGRQKSAPSLKSATHEIRSIKQINQVIYLLSSTDISIFSLEINNFCYIRKYRHRLHFLILLTFFESVKVILINIVAILMMEAKLDTLGLLKIEIFWNEGYDVIICVHNVTIKILSLRSNCIVDVVMWPKFGNCSISMREVIIISIL